MKKYIISLVFLLVAVLCFVVGIMWMFGYVVHFDDPTAIKVMFLKGFGFYTILYGLYMVYLSGRSVGFGRPIKIGLYLYDGQVVRLRGFHASDKTIHLLLEIKPDELGYSTIHEEAPVSFCEHLVLGHRYRYLDQEFISLQVGDKS